MAEWFKQQLPAQRFEVASKLTRNGKPKGAGTGPLYLMTPDIARGTIVVGVPGSGKTFAMKQIVENFCSLTSMRH
eukprot:6525854-Prymnesium_polylepis.2